MYTVTPTLTKVGAVPVVSVVPVTETNTIKIPAGVGVPEADATK